VTRFKIVGGLFLLSGLTGLVHEIVWIRLFALGFGNAAQALSTVLSVYLAGLALGALGAAKFKRADGLNSLRLYGFAEVLIGAYACAIPRLIQSTQPVLRLFYGTGEGAQIEVLLARVVSAAAILGPATLLTGATLPFLAQWISSTNREDAGQKIGLLYTLNLAGASAGALVSGFVLLPALGFMRTLLIACALNATSGLAALFLARKTAPERVERIAVKNGRTAGVPAREVLPGNLWIASAFFSGLSCMLYEVAWSRVYGLLLGSTASTLILILAAFLIGLTLGAMTAAWWKRNFTALIAATQFGSIAMLLCSIIAAGNLPQTVARWVQSRSFEPAQIEWMKVALLTTTLLPLTIVLGLTFPLLLRIAPQREISWAQRIGGAYGINTTGCILGSFLTGWVLVPWTGTETTLLLGAALNAGLGLVLLHRVKPRWTRLACVATAAVVLSVAIALPRWDMIAFTAGGYKYAPYYDSVAQIPQALDKAELISLHEGISGTVAVRKEAGSLLLSIDGKVDASDSGGDLLTEKLLAHIPLMLNPNAHRVCLIGLASGVTAGAILAHPVNSLDVVELSPDVVHASHFYDSVNLRPLDDRRTSLIVNDGRNHLELTSSRYDMIVSEPSNPWIAGMNSLFTRDFFRLAKERLSPDGMFAQWFHIYNMPKDDLDSLLRSFSDVFPSAMLWQMNDGDVLLTGFAGEAPNFDGSARFPAGAIEDLSRVGVSDPSFLWNMYVMRDSDIGRFAAGAAPNTDDDPRLEFHGQRDLHAQTDIRNTADLASFKKQLAPPPAALRVIEGMSKQRLVSFAGMFERAESRGRAFDYYRLAFQKTSSGEGEEALAGMDRTARLPEERAAVALALALPQSQPDTIESRTTLALEKAHSGDTARARFLFAEYADAHPQDSAARLNYGLFCLEHQEYQLALAQFRAAISLNPAYLPAFEATAETYLQLKDVPNAIQWSRRILEIDPNHSVAKQTLAALQRGGR
jgi:spermidine synthase